MSFEAGNRVPAAHADAIWAVRWCHDAVITAGLDAKVKFWQPSSLSDAGPDAPPTPISIFEGHSLAVVSVAVNSAGTVAASRYGTVISMYFLADGVLSSMDGFIITYDVKERKQLQKIGVGPTKNWSMSLSDQLMATGGHEGAVHLYNYHSGDNVSSTISISNPFVLSVQFNASCQRLAVGGSKGEGRLSCSVFMTSFNTFL